MCRTKISLYHSRKKHIDVQYHKIREWCNKEIDLYKIDTQVNLADVLTKVSIEKFKAALTSIQVLRLEGYSSFVVLAEACVKVLGYG